MAAKSISLPQAWMMAVRIRTLLIPSIQVAASTGLAYVVHGSIEWSIAIGAWFIAVLITIGTNLINDVIDFEKGGDPLNRFGQLKVIRAGLLSKSSVFIAGMAALGIACAMPFLLHLNAFICFLVILSAICGYCYTGGPFPISYLGLSELFIFIFYGGVCIITPFYVQTGAINAAVVLLSVQLGMLAILPNALNNFRDIFEDAAVNKRTLAVRFGKTFARREIALLTFTPFILNIAWIFLGYPEAALMPLLLVPLAYIFVRGVLTTEPGPIFNRYFGLSVLVHFLFGAALTGGLLFA